MKDIRVNVNDSLNNINPKDINLVKQNDAYPTPSQKPISSIINKYKPLAMSLDEVPLKDLSKNPQGQLKSSHLDTINESRMDKVGTTPVSREQIYRNVSNNEQKPRYNQSLIESHARKALQQQ